MDRQIENSGAIAAATETGTEKIGLKRYRSPHLMCRTPLWGAAGFIGCAYFAWVSFGHVTRHEYEWPHDLWTAATYVVWILLLTGLALDTRCRRERLFFGVLVLNFAIGCGLTLWYDISPAEVRAARIGTGALWALAALFSLTTLANVPDTRRNGP
jgi:hypothetical protein